MLTLGSFQKYLKGDKPMNLEKILATENLCINDNLAPCIASCPIHVDVKGFIEQIQKGDFKSAYKILQKRMPMAKIIARVCDHPCYNSCVRNNKGGSVLISDLEKAVVQYGANAKIKKLPIRDNNKKVAIIGGGISGLTCAIDLRSKGYLVTIFEKDNTLGGRLRKKTEDIIPSSILEEEIDNIQKSGIQIKKGKTISRLDIDKLKCDYEAVYIGTGNWEEKLDVDNTTFQTQIKGVFCGGRIVTGNESIILSVSTGRRSAISIDRYINKKSLVALRDNEGSYKTKLKVDTKDIDDCKQVVINTKEDAILEAKRCILCECHKCYKACSHLQYEKLDPKAYIRKINQNERVILGDRYANKTINSCMLCGLCKTECPSNIDMSEIIRETRKSMVQKGKMPLSAHDFALKDMEFNNSDYFTLLKHQPNMNESKFLFFPGCQLCGSYPEYVQKSYDYLIQNLDGGVGLYLGCCGAPGEWAGREDLFEESMKNVSRSWELMGKPIIIVACSTCYYIFKKYLPHIKLVTLWEVLNEKGVSNEIKKHKKDLVMHDSCTARDYPNIHDSVRKILSKLGYGVIEPKYTKKNTQCCGYGGLSYFANKEFSNYATDKRIEEHEGDYLAYCAMCRDLFVSRGKNTFHILDLIFGENIDELSSKKGPTLSQRRDNRLKLKMSILNIWGEKIDLKEDYGDINLIIDQNVKDIMDDRLILEGDIKKVIGMAEENKNIFFNPKTNKYLAFRRIVNVTYWVEYEKICDDYKIIKTYTHRMDIQGE
jgi:NADPH-dependent glutamate synthase beta subunit-like oxidoreductase